MIRRKRIGEMLVEAELLSEASLQEAMAAPRPAGMKLGQYLIREGIVREEDVMEALSSQLRIGRYRPESFPMDEELAGKVPPAMAARQKVIPLRVQGGVLYAAMPDPTDVVAMDSVQEKAGMEVEPVICTEEEFDGLMAGLYGIGSGESGVPEEMEAVEYGLSEEPEAGVDEAEVRSLLEVAEEQTAVRNVNWILVQAVRNQASDVHISPERGHVRIRMRVDGILKELPSLPKAMEASVISRLKILANMDISVTRIPQDGRFTVRIGGREIHLRVSSLPTIHGENLVLRLLGLQSLVVQFDQLGMRPPDVAKVERAIGFSSGLILSTGPTGSGKTTTLYAMLSRLNEPDVNIITVEDPVEYRVSRIRQVELNSKAGMTFAGSLRAILRQDPDIIMVGEIRDRETANLAVQASLTGHLVLSTMHTNDAVGTISRLLEMEVEPFLISSVLNLVLAQRLVRKLCVHCGEPWQPPAEALAFWGLGESAAGADFRRARGCHRCRQSGYRGRLGLYECLPVTAGVQQGILRGEPEQGLVETAAAEGGFTTLREDAAGKILEGLTSMEEAASIAMSSASSGGE